MLYIEEIRANVETSVTRIAPHFFNSGRKFEAGILRDVFQNLVENCNPSSIRIQVSEGGGRVAQLSKPPKSSDTTTSTSKPKPPPPCAPCKSPSFTNLTDKGDNYEDVGMDVESSSCESEPEHKDDTGILLSFSFYDGNLKA